MEDITRKPGYRFSPRFLLRSFCLLAAAMTSSQPPFWKSVDTLQCIPNWYFLVFTAVIQNAQGMIDITRCHVIHWTTVLLYFSFGQSPLFSKPQQHISVLIEEQWQPTLQDDYYQTRQSSWVRYHARMVRLSAGDMSCTFLITVTWTSPAIVTWGNPTNSPLAMFMIVMRQDVFSLVHTTSRWMSMKCFTSHSDRSSCILTHYKLLIWSVVCRFRKKMHVKTLLWYIDVPNVGVLLFCNVTFKWKRKDKDNKDSKRKTVSDLVPSLETSMKKGRRVREY